MVSKFAIYMKARSGSWMLAGKLESGALAMRAAREMCEQGIVAVAVPYDGCRPSDTSIEHAYAQFTT